MAEEKYECDLCGACCRRRMVELTTVDLLREPRLGPLARPCTVDLVPEGSDEAAEGKSYRSLALVGAGLSGDCPFLGGDSRCGIYPTRPAACVSVPAGGEDCQSERARHGLPPLLPLPQANHG